MTIRNDGMPHDATRSALGTAAFQARYLFIVAILICAASAGLYAQESDGFHVRVFGGSTTPDSVTTVDEVGIVTPDIDTDDATSYGVAIGKRLFSPGLRWEVEYARRSADVDGEAVIMIPSGLPQFGGAALDVPANVAGDVSMDSLFLNVAYDFNVDGRVSPFVQAGIGYARVSVDSLTFATVWSTTRVPGADNDGVALSYGAGVTFRASSNVSVDLLYRAIDYGSVLTDPSPSGLGKDEFDVALDDLSVGVRFSF